MFRPAVWSIRLPVVLAGAVSVWLFVRWTQKLSGLRAACIAGFLLATDPSFILTNTFDWGPVALQHLLLMAGCLLIASQRCALAFLCFGLAFWDKAIFLWVFSGLIVASLITSWAAIREWMAGKRRVGFAALGFGIGILPLLVYNVHSPMATSRANIHASFADIGNKLISFRETLAGSDLFGVVVSPGSHRWLPDHTLFFAAFLIAIASTPFLPRSKARTVAVFAIVVCVVSFGLMASLRYTGAAHHIVLLYPFPQLLVASTVAVIRPVRLSTAVAILLIIANLLVTSHYLVQLDLDGPTGLFTDAIYPLATYMDGAKAGTVCTLDLGIRDSLNLLTQGKLRAQEEVISSLSRETAIDMVSRRDVLFISRAGKSEYFRGNAASLESLAENAGYERSLSRMIEDSRGRPQFQIFSFLPRKIAP
ncbi:MAG TPA: hypothetical protein VHC90_11105 [Bryobacteraceae bacterium]|nr:hypothetical protein [Bryobacteraceae bacterium]